MSALTDNLFYPSEERLWMCIRLNNAGKWACDRLTEDADLGKKIIFSEEAHLDLGGYVNKQNCRICCTENPHASGEKPAHPKRVTVWCKWARRIRYSQWRSLSGHVERIFVHKSWRGWYCNIWFQQDGTTCHTAQDTLDVLRPMFEDRIGYFFKFLKLHA